MKFPSTVVTLQFSAAVTPDTASNLDQVNSQEQYHFPSMDVRTNDGLQIYIDISFTYLIDTTNLTALTNIYYTMGEALRQTDYIYQLARSKVRDVAAGFIAYEFFKNRTDIQTAMHQSMAAEIITFYATLDQFALVNINLPQQYQDALQATEQARQAVEQAQFQRVTDLVAAGTRVAQAERHKEIVETFALGVAQGIQAQNTADITQLNYTLSTETNALHIARTDLNFNSTQLLSYAFVDAIKSAKQSMTVALQEPVQI